MVARRSQLTKLLQSGLVRTGMDDCLAMGKPSRYVTSRTPRLTQPGHAFVVDTVSTVPVNSEAWMGTPDSARALYPWSRTRSISWCLAGGYGNGVQHHPVGLSGVCSFVRCYGQGSMLVWVLEKRTFGII